MTYLGALKTWLYAPIFALWAPSVWSIRLPMVLLGGGTILLLALLLERLFGRTSAWVGTMLLATDTSLVLTTTFDWGPVALQHFLFAAAAWLLWRFHQEPGAWRLALAAFLLGLALWNKAIFAWTLMGSGAALLLYPRELWRHCGVRNLALAAVFFAGGASMLIRYNVRHPGATFSDNAKLSLENVGDKHIHVRAMLEGSSLLGFMIAEDNYLTVRWSYMPYVVALAALVALLARRRSLVFPLLAGFLTWLAMAVTKDAGGSIHHSILIYPYPHWVVAGVAGLPWFARYHRVVLALALLLAVDNVRLVALHRANGQRLGGGVIWSDALFPLVDEVKRRNPQAIRMYDWGMQDNLIVLSARALPITYAARPFGESAFTDFSRGAVDCAGERGRGGRECGDEGGGGEVRL